MKLFDNYIYSSEFFVRDSGMKLFETDLSEGTLLERLWLWHKTIGKLVQRAVLRYSGRPICEIFLQFLR